KTQIGSIVTSLRKGDVFDVLHGLFFVTILGTYLAEKLQNLKLSHPPDLEYPDIIRSGTKGSDIMSSHPAGTCQKKLFSQNDYLAPLPLPTGQQPVDSLNIIWR
ncbi:hypothetical protein A258_07917, partial [Pseudomonas syringae pv. actinidiae ICMP 19104]